MDSRRIEGTDPLNGEARRYAYTMVSRSSESHRMFCSREARNDTHIRTLHRDIRHDAYTEQSLAYTTRLDHRDTFAPTDHIDIAVRKSTTVVTLSYYT